MDHNYRSLYHLFIKSILMVCTNINAAQPVVNIPVKAITTSTGGDVDDCAIWIHPTDQSKSLVIINDKGPLKDKSGLFVYDLFGAQLQNIPVYCPQNPDIRYDVVFGNDTMDVLVCVDRKVKDLNYNMIRVFKINSEKSGGSSDFLTEITSSSGIPTGQNEAYGHSLYLRPTDGALFSVVSAANETADFTQIRLESDGYGRVKGTLVRKWGCSDITGDICEGICCDDELGFVYICDENAKVLKYYADPDKKINTLVGTFAHNDGIELDREGISIYRCSETFGYILLSSQGNNQIKVYDRITNSFLGTVIPDGMKDCDGLDVTATPLGTQFPHGMAAFHLGSSAGAQFGFYDWSDIATGLNLAAPCDAERPHRTLNASVNKNSKYKERVQQKSVITNRSAIYDLQGKLIALPTGSITNNGATTIYNGHIILSGVYLREQHMKRNRLGKMVLVK